MLAACRVQRENLRGELVTDWPSMQRLWDDDIGISARIYIFHLAKSNKMIDNCGNIQLNTSVSLSVKKMILKFVIFAKKKLIILY